MRAGQVRGGVQHPARGTACRTSCTTWRPTRASSGARRPPWASPGSRCCCSSRTRPAGTGALRAVPGSIHNHPRACYTYPQTLLCQPCAPVCNAYVRRLVGAVQCAPTYVLLPSALHPAAVGSTALNRRCRAVLGGVRIGRWVAIFISTGLFCAHVRRRLGWVSPLGPITVASLSIGAVWAGGLERRAGIRVVGAIQPGLPPLTVCVHGISPPFDAYVHAQRRVVEFHMHLVSHSWPAPADCESIPGCAPRLTRAGVPERTCKRL